MDPLIAFGCTELRPLVEQGVFRVGNPSADASVAWETLSLDILPLRERTRRGITTYSVEVLRDADAAAERAATYRLGEGPQRKYTVEANHEYAGNDFVEDFDDVDELKKEVESMGAEAEASMREAERTVTTELDTAKAEVEGATTSALEDKPPVPAALPDKPADTEAPASHAESGLNGAGPHQDAEPEPAPEGERAEHKAGA